MSGRPLPVPQREALELLQEAARAGVVVLSGYRTQRAGTREHPDVWMVAGGPVKALERRDLVERNEDTRVVTLTAAGEDTDA